MKYFICICFCFIMLHSIALYGGGVEVDENGNVTVEHYIIKLSKSQVADVMKTRILTLTNSQYIIFKQYKIPRKISILTGFHNWCTCGSVMYGIWTKIDEVSIPKNFVLGYKDFLKSEMYKNLSSAPNKPNPNYDKMYLKIYFDHSLRMHYKNQIIDKEELLTIVNNFYDPNLEQTIIFYMLPLNIHSKDKLERLRQDLIQQIRNTESKLSIMFY